MLLPQHRFCSYSFCNAFLRPGSPFSGTLCSKYFCRRDTGCFSTAMLRTHTNKKMLFALLPSVCMDGCVLIQAFCFFSLCCTLELFSRADCCKCSIHVLSNSSCLIENLSRGSSQAGNMKTKLLSVACLLGRKDEETASHFLGRSVNYVLTKTTKAIRSST